MSSINKLTLFIIFGATLSFGCNAKPATTPGGDDPTFQDHWTHTNPGDRGPGSLDPLGGEGAEGKQSRRLSIDELRRSIPTIFGGITWTVGQGRNAAVGFDSLSRTLGEADYIQSTVNNLDPTPLFAKFMDDMAGDVCQKAVAHDRDTPSPSDRIINREADVDSNLRYLRLKLQGIFVAEGSIDGLEDLRALYDDLVAATGDADQAWFGVCVAMVTAPEFMAY